MRFAVSSVAVAIACGGPGSQPAATPQNSTPASPAPTSTRQLPDESCLRLGVERYPDDGPRGGPGSCRLARDTHPPTGRRCVATLGDLGREDLELSGCYRQHGTSFTLDYATLDKNQAEVVFQFDGKDCAIIGASTWAKVAPPAKAFIVKTIGCTNIRDDFEF